MSGKIHNDQCQLAVASSGNWPPRPGELWVADGEWPTYGFDGLKGQEILPGDVFLVIETLGVRSSAARQYAELNVLFRGQTRLIASERFNGVPDMHKLEAHETR